MARNDENLLTRVGHQAMAIRPCKEPQHKHFAEAATSSSFLPQQLQQQAQEQQRQLFSTDSAQWGSLQPQEKYFFDPLSARLEADSDGDSESDND